jgi:ABC-2 type transport system permease protein
MGNGTRITDQFFLLQRYRLSAWKNNFSHPTREKKIRWGVIAVMAALFVYGDFVFFLRIVRYLDGLPMQIGEEIIAQMMNVVFLTLFVMVWFSSLIVSLSVFYMSKDLDLIHSLPVRMGTFIFSRFQQGVTHSSWMVLLFTFPIFSAYGYFFQVPWTYYLYLLLNILPFIILACLLGALVIMGLMRYFPAKKAHQTLSFLGLIFLVGAVVYLRFLSPEKFFGQEVSNEQILLFMESLKVPDYKFLPTSWVSYGLTSWVGGDFKIALTQSLYLYSAALVGLAVLWITGRKIYFDGWTLVQEANHAPVPKKEWERSRTSFLKNLPIGSTQQALLEKDMKIFSRDPEQWSQIFILCALVFVYIFNIMNLPLSNVALKNVTSVLNIGLIGFVLSALVSRFVFTATSLEGKSMWAIYSAPVEMKKFVWSKFWMFFPPLLLIAEFLLIVSNYLLQVDIYVMTVSFIGVFLITLGLVGMGIGLGAVYPSFNHDNISEIPAGTGGILFMTMSLGFVGLVLMLVGRPMYVHFNEKFLYKSLGGIDVPICYALIFILSLSAAYLPIQRGISSLKKMDI